MFVRLGPVGSGNVPGALAVVHQVDVIAGDVTTRAQPGTPAYATATNPFSHVLARFTASEWTTDAQGYKVMTHTLTATKDQYFRLRGTNLSPDVPGETENGEPLPDAKIDSLIRPPGSMPSTTATTPICGFTRIPSS